MTLKFCDGFDHYAEVGDTGTNVSDYLTAAGYTVRNPTTATFAVVTGRRSTMKALQFTTTAGSSTPPSLSWGFTNTETLTVFGFAFYATGARQRLCRIENIIDIEWDATTGKMMVGTAYGASVLILAAWYYMEVVIDSSALTAAIYVNDELQMTVDLTGTTIPSTKTIVWGQTSAQENSAVLWIDDFYVLNNAGSVNTARLSPIEITSRAPTSDTTTEWDLVANGTGYTSHYQVAAQTKPGASGKAYLQTNTTGDKDVFRSNATLPTSNTVYGVALVAYAKKGDLDDRAIGMYMEVDGGASSETQVSLDESYKYIQATYDQAPGNISWTQNIVESLYFGAIAR